MLKVTYTKTSNLTHPQPIATTHHETKKCPLEKKKKKNRFNPLHNTLANPKPHHTLPCTVVYNFLLAALNDPKSPGAAAYDFYVTYISSRGPVISNFRPSRGGGEPHNRIVSARHRYYYIIHFRKGISASSSSTRSGRRRPSAGRRHHFHRQPRTRVGGHFLRLIGRAECPDGK